MNTQLATGDQFIATFRAGVLTLAFGPHAETVQLRQDGEHWTQDGKQRPDLAGLSPAQVVAKYEQLLAVVWSPLTVRLPAKDEEPPATAAPPTGELPADNTALTGLAVAALTLVSN